MARNSDVVERRLRTTLELNTGNFARDFNNVNNLLRDAQNEVRNTSREMRSFGQNTNTLTNSMNALTRQYELQSARADIYRTGIERTTRAYEDNINRRRELSTSLREANQRHEEAVRLHGAESEAARQAADEVSRLQTEYDRTSRNLQNNERALRRYNTGLRNTETDISLTRRSLEQTSATLDRMNNRWLQSAEAMQVYQRRLNSVANTANSLGNAMIRGGTLIATGVAGGLKAYGEFGDSLAKVNSIAGLTVGELDSLGNKIKTLSNDLGVPINALAEAEYQALSASVEVGKSMEFLETSSKLAKGGFTEVTGAVDVLSSVLNAYNMETEEAARISDILITTQNLGKVTVGELADKLGEVIPTAKNASVNIENVGTSIAVLTSQGIKPAQSITYLNSLFNEFSKSGTKVSKVLKEETGKSFAELSAEGNSVSDILLIIDKYSKKTGTSFNDLFGSVEAVKGAIGLLAEEGTLYTSTLNKMNQSAGATQKAFEGIASTDMEKARKAMNELMNSFIKLGAASTPILHEISGAITSLANTIENMEPETLSMIANTGKWLLILGGGTKVISGLLKAGANITSIFGRASQVIGANGGIAGSLTALAGGAKAAILAINPLTAAITVLGGGAFLAWRKATEVQKEKQDLLNKSLEKTQDILKNGISPDNIQSAEIEIGDLQGQVEDLNDFKDAMNDARTERDLLMERKIALEEKVWENPTKESIAYQKELVGINERIGELDNEILVLDGSIANLTDDITKQTGTVEAAEKQVQSYQKALKDAKDTKELMKKATNEHTKALVDEYGELIRAKTRVETLAQEYHELSEQEKLSQEETKRLKQVQSELVDVLGEGIVQRDSEGRIVGIKVDLLQKEINATLGVGAAAKKRTVIAAQAGIEHVKNTKRQVFAVLEAIKMEQEALAGRTSWNDPRRIDTADMNTAQRAYWEAQKQYVRDNTSEAEKYLEELDKLQKKLEAIDEGDGYSSGSYGGTGSGGEIEKDLMREALNIFEQKKKLNMLAMDEEMRYLKDIEKAYAKSIEQKIEMNEYMLDNYLDILERRKAAGNLYHDEELKMLEIARDQYAITESTKIDLDNRINEKKLEHAYKWVDKQKHYNKMTLDEEKAAYERMLEYAKKNADETEDIKREIYRVEQEILEKEVQAVKDATDKKIKEREREKQAKYDEIDETLKKELNKYQSQLDALDRLEEEERRREREKAHTDKINSLQDKLTGATTDAERNSIIAEMNSENESYEKYLRDEKRKKEREDLRTKMEAARQEAQAQKEQAEKAFKDQVAILTKQQEVFINYLTGKTDGTEVTEQGITTFLTGEYSNRNVLFKSMVDKDIAYLQGAATIMQGIYSTMFGGLMGVGRLGLPNVPKGSSKTVNTNTSTVNYSPTINATYHVGSNGTAKALTTEQENMFNREARNLGVKR